MNETAKKHYEKIAKLQKEIEGIKEFQDALGYEMTSRNVCDTFIRVEVKKTFMAMFSNRVKMTVPIPDKLNIEIDVKCKSWIGELERRIIKESELLNIELKKPE